MTRRPEGFDRRLELQGWRFAQMVQCAHGHWEETFTHDNLPGLVWHRDCMGHWDLVFGEVRPQTSFFLCRHDW